MTVLDNVNETDETLTDHVVRVLFTDSVGVLDDGGSAPATPRDDGSRWPREASSDDCDWSRKISAVDLAKLPAGGLVIAIGRSQLTRDIDTSDLTCIFRDNILTNF